MNEEIGLWSMVDQKHSLLLSYWMAFELMQFDLEVGETFDCPKLMTPWLSRSYMCLFQMKRDLKITLNEKYCRTLMRMKMFRMSIQIFIFIYYYSSSKSIWCNIDHYFITFMPTLLAVNSQLKLLFLLLHRCKFLPFRTSHLSLSALSSMSAKF